MDIPAEAIPSWKKHANKRLGEDILTLGELLPGHVVAIDHYSYRFPDDGTDHWIRVVEVEHLPEIKLSQLTFTTYNGKQRTRPVHDGIKFIVKVQSIPH